MAVEDVPCGRDEATAMTHSIQRVCVDLKVALTVCFCREGRQTYETDKGTLTCSKTKVQQVRGLSLKRLDYQLVH